MDSFINILSIDALKALIKEAYCKHTLLEHAIKSMNVPLVLELVKTDLFSGEENHDAIGFVGGGNHRVTRKSLEYMEYDNINQQIADILFENGLDVNKAGYCHEFGKYIVNAIGRVTFKKKFNPNCRDGLFGTPFWHELRGNLIDQFISESAKTDNFTEPIDINAQDNDGNTVFHMRNDIRALLKYNPDVLITNKKGLNVLEFRIKYNKSTGEIYQYLHLKGIDYNHNICRKMERKRDLNEELLNLKYRNDLCEKENAKLMKKIEKLETQLQEIRMLIK